MIDLYTWKTPNGRKVTIALEELGFPYTLHAVNIGQGEQRRPEFLALNPNGKIPAIVDHEPRGGGAPLAIFESGAILMYLADKSGQLGPTDERGRYEALEWMMFQMSAVGPMFGQLSHFVRFAKEKIPYAIERYTAEANRILGVLNGRLDGRPFLLGDYSIVDIATYPWLAFAESLGLSMEPFPNVRRWLEALASRPAVQRGMELPTA